MAITSQRVILLWRNLALGHYTAVKQRLNRTETRWVICFALAPL